MKKKKIIVIIIFILIISCIYVYRNHFLRLIYPKNYGEIVTKYARQNDIDTDLIFALIKSESNFKSKAESHKGAKGLMQLMEETANDVAKDVGVDLKQDDLLDPETNIKLGTKYLHILLEKYKSIEIALTAYNAGGGNVDKWIEDGVINADGSNIEAVPFKETNNYVRSILRDYKIYKKIY